MYRRRTTGPLPFRNLTIQLSGPGCVDTIPTDGHGEFVFDHLAEGTYTVSVSNGGCRFKAPSWTVEIAGKDKRVPFVGVCP
jgi:hypothetical protein